MASYRISPRAEADLEDIWRCTAKQWSVKQAAGYHANMVDAIEKLASGERHGRKVETREGYRKYQVGQHFVFYRPSNGGIDVIRVLHQRMDLEHHL